MRDGLGARSGRYLAMSVLASPRGAYKSLRLIPTQRKLMALSWANRLLLKELEAHGRSAAEIRNQAMVETVCNLQVASAARI